MSDLRDDYYIFDEDHYMLIGEHTGRTYKLGQKVRVMIAGTDKILKTINMVVEQ